MPAAGQGPRTLMARNGQNADMMIKRGVSSSVAGTFGMAIWQGLPFAVTLELPWRNNTRNVSCIPGGRYVCRRVKSPKFGATFEITNVPGRTAILFHKGNLPRDVRGCVILAESFDPVDGQPGVTRSAEAFNEFMDLTRGRDTFILEVE